MPHRLDFSKMRFLNSRFFISFWPAFHGAVLALFVIFSLAGRHFSVDADLFHMLPSSTLGEAMGKADEKLSDTTSKNVFILVGHEDFQTAKETAETVYSKLSPSEHFTSLSLHAGLSAVSEIEEFVAPYRWQLLGDDETELLSTEEGAFEFAQETLSRAFGSFSLTSLSHIDQDPFLLDELNTQKYLLAAREASTRMQPKDGVLASQFEGLWYVMIRGSLSSSGSAIASKKNGIAKIYEVCTPLEKDGIRFVYSGTPFHSHKSSNSALKEISTISTISLSIVILMLIFVFRSPVPLFASLASIIISIGTAFLSTMLVFGQIHILTLILGTSLIGSCIDYSLHYFVNWKAHASLKTPDEIRRHLFKGLFLSMLSTEICYTLLIFAPFNILRQMGVFSSIGIFSSFLTVVCLYPLFPLPKAEKRKLSVPVFNAGNVRWKRFFSPALFIVMMTITIIFHKDVRIHNDMFKLYSMEGRVKEDTELCTRITGYYPQGWFIISGETEEALLENEESVVQQLAAVQDRGYLATTSFIPSLKKQERSAQAAKALIPYVKEQFALLGFSETDADAFLAQFDSALARRLMPSEKLPDVLKSITDMLWLGEIDGKFYSIVLPVRITDEKAYEKIAEENDSVYYENKMKDLGIGLDRLTRLAIMLFCIAYAIILIVLKRFYTWRQTAKIASLPILCVLLIVGVFLLIGQSIEFFSLTGIILVFGLGLDYIIYMIENMKRSERASDKASPEQNLEPFAITLSFLTTAISFGALAFSTFVPVHTIGLSITLGLIAAFFCTIL